MQLKVGANVYSADDKQVGTVKCVVINPDTMEVTHLVIQQGHLFTTNRLAPVSSIYSGDEEHVYLHQASNELALLPEFECVRLIPGESGGRSNAISSTLIGYASTGSISVPPVSGHLVETIQNIPKGTVVVQESTRVISSDGHHVGNVDRIITAPGDELVTQLVITQGLVWKVRKLIPTYLLSHVIDGEIRLTVDAQVLDRIPDYKPKKLQWKPVY
jgi:uncharacterized protein YrrD